jgi:hypothetical protein
MKLPKCPHCEKLLLMVMGDMITVGGNEVSRDVVYICPEKLVTQQPDWVEVMELTS